MTKAGSLPKARRRDLSWGPASPILVIVLAGWLAAAPAAGQDAQPGRLMPDGGNAHVAQGTHVDYPSYPPTSGTHWPQPAAWGVYDKPVPDEQFVHNLEHGGVVILYHCAGSCAELVRELQTLYKTLPASKYGYAKVVLSPSDRLKTRIALLAWRRLDEFERFDRERILRFVRAYQDKGPEDVP